MKTAAIAIGVNKTGMLPILGGAVSGAEKFAKWADDQGYKVILITDAGGNEVTLKRVRDAVKDVTNTLTYSKLIVFFSGHGFLLSPQSELWLLSQAPDPETEAVNVRLSAEFARYSGIPHIIFVSDACRSGGSTHSHRSVTGGAIFPNQQTSADAAEIDTFYATRPGDTALELPDKNEAVKNYKGILTDCLLRALEGEAPEVVVEQATNTGKLWVLPCRNLKGYLKTCVPLAAEEVDIKLSQRPEIRVESALPDYFGRLEHPPYRSAFDHKIRSARVKPGLGDFVELTQDRVMSFDSGIDIQSEAMTESARAFETQMHQIALSRGRDHYETETGFSVYGAVRNALAGGGVTNDVFTDDEVTHIRVHDAGDYAARSILIELESGIGTVLAVMKGFIGTVTMDGEKIVNVSYTPSSNTTEYQTEYEPDSERIERRRAFAAAATRNGMFELSSRDAKDAGDYLRMGKKMDPTLGIYAAYAYSQAGQTDLVRDVLRYMEYSPPVPFDVVLLARQENGEFAAMDYPVAPFCPMLRQGWSLLELNPQSAAALSAFRRLLLPSLWTTFSAEGVALVRTALESGEIS